jgi:glyoxylase-like metal-dependent hydrolase (beta-lactamase superfamily II)/rhodanese-related sulfurtransferase
MTDSAGVDSEIPTIEVDTLREWLESGTPVTVVDIRPAAQRAEWLIPGSIHIDATGATGSRSRGSLDAFIPSARHPVITVCAAGRTSLRAAAQLRSRGIDARSLNGGMRAWSLAWNTAELPPLHGGISVIQVRRTGKGCMSYMVGADGEAAIIDASVDTQVYRSIARGRRWKISALIETHVHADHLSRSRALAEELGAALYIPAQERISFPYTPVLDGDSISIGSAAGVLRALRTPGHTAESTCYVLAGRLLFSGDTLFVNGVGRPDLETGIDNAEHRGRQLYHSLQRLLQEPGETMVLPAHSSDPVRFDGIPIGARLDLLRKENRMLRLAEDDFVRMLMSSIPATPPNFETIVEYNKSGDRLDADPTILEAGANRCAVG